MRMHLIIFIILTTCMNVFSNAAAQTVSLQFDQAKLETVLRSITQQSGYEFNYEVSLLETAKPVTLHLRNKPIREVLAACFRDQPIRYTIVANNIVLRSKPAAPAPSLPAQDTIIRGRITDTDDRPLVGVTVLVKGSDVGTMTDTDGRFAIGVPDPNAILLIRSVGYIPIQQSVKGKTFIEVSLIASTEQLQEVTVQPIQTGYEKISPERFVGSATVIDSTLLQRGVSSDVLSRLDGVANGLLFNKAGGTLKLQLRGYSTLYASYDYDNNDIGTNPLIILDDFPYQGNLDNLNPNDIESISILKDAAATSIWGARAGNGVIVITTKKGAARNRFSVTVNSNLQIESKPNLDYYHRMNSSDFIDVERYLFDKGYQNTSLRNAYAYAISPAVDLLYKNREGLISDAELEAGLNTLKSISLNDQYDRYVFRNPIKTQNFISVAGGNPTTSYNISFGADNGKTSIKGPGKRDRYSVNSSLVLKPTRWLEISSIINYSTENFMADGINTNIAPGGRRINLYPYAAFADDAGNHLAIPYDYRMSYIDTIGQGRLLDWHYRPLDEMEYGGRNGKRNYLRLNLGGNIKLTNWLNVDVKYQYSDQNQINNFLHDERTYFTRDLLNVYTAPGTFEMAIPYGSILDRSYKNVISHNGRVQLNVQKNWSNRHSFTAIAAGEIGESKLNGNSERVYGLDRNILVAASNVNFGIAYPKRPSGMALIPNNVAIDGKADKFISVLANASYTYADKYNLFLSARRDGSNLLGINTNNRWKPLWSVGGRWNLHSEPFYKVNWMDKLSFRATYGYSGNINNSISSLVKINYSSVPSRFGQTYAFVSSPYNPDLRWEEVRTLNFGIDFGMFHNRVSGSIEYYQKKSVDILTSVPVDPSLGLPGNVIETNAGNLKTTGIDFALMSKNIDRKFKWTTIFNLNQAVPKVTRYYYNFVSTPLGPSLREGGLIGGLYGYKWAGLDPENGDPRGYLGKDISKDYNSIFVDSVENQQYLGSSYPLWAGNIMNTLSYKGIEFSFNISYKGNYYFRKPSILYSSLYLSWVSHSDFEKRWQNPGDEKNTVIPSMPYPANVSRDKFFQYSEANFEKGDHIRLQDIRLAYDFRNMLQRKWQVRSLQLFAYASNLNLLIWKAGDSDYDPDFPTNNLLPLRSFSFGVRATL